MKRALVRLLALAVPVSFVALVWLTVRVVRRTTHETGQWLQTVQAVQRLNWEAEDAKRNRSGVPDHMTRTIVMAKMKHEDTDWVAEQLPNWQRAIYSVDDTHAAHFTHRNKGHEANVYLQYLIDYYDDLPDFVLFMHPHRNGFPAAWHTDNDDYDNAQSARSLRLDFVQRNGYANLRCLHSPGCPDGVRPFRSPPDPLRTHEHAFAAAWRDLMGPLAPVPDQVGVACCSQFAVSAAQVRKRAKTEYERYHRWLMGTELDDAVSGRVMEHLWHIIFGQEPVYCPDLLQCYCDVYGACPSAQLGP